nr:cytochrome b/b6 domain-containing protein [Arthrobacter sp. SLBN-100]
MAITLAVAALAAIVLIAQWMRTLPPVQNFLTTYPGTVDLPEGAPLGLPPWLGWQHYLNAFFLVLIIRSGWLVRTTARPKEHWTRNNSGPIRTRGKPAKISLNLWFHLTLDALWVTNGVVFIILLVVTGQWMRIVPTSWDVFPNALSTAIQYASLNWPTENGWVNYNSLQVLAYFSIVFITAPLALVTGLRMSGAWPKNAHVLNKMYPIEVARAIHFPVMLYFVGFVVVHVALVFATGVLHNLNHMYASNDGAGWTGFWIFAASVAVIVAAWFLARPLFLRPVASIFGKVTR